MVRTLDDPSLDEQERKALEDVRDHGLHNVHVMPEEGSPGWSFSIGLYQNFGHPEIVVFGLSDDVAQWLLNDVARRIRAGERFGDGSEADDLLEGVPCMFRTIAPGWHGPFLGWMDWFYESDETPVLQCIWPDHDRAWPWDPAFRADWIWAQPLLYTDDAVAARAVRLLESMALWPPDPPVPSA